MARIKQGVFSWEDVLAQRYQNNKPSALPRLRKHSALPNRSLAPSPTQKQPDTRLVWTVSDSLLLSKLSTELRLMVWEMVLGGMRIHIVQRSNRRMSHVVCPRTATCEICRGGLPIIRDGNTVLMALPLVCKQIYCESIHLLYALNVFEFSNTWSLTYLRPTVPKDLWDTIREVELRWAFPGHWLPSKDPVKSIYFSAGRQQWIDTCQALTRMSGLQSFTLQLSGSWFCEPVEKIPVFLEPLRGLNLKQRWKLQLPGQPYYVKEIRNIDRDLRKRGIECLVRAV
ncbi:hypothetical protein EYZ11_001624 [Aspergillus tanneri]|uniref:DUF7730 domain-containing protein n=1 Tax=Aspergillus tanneri TaxID=1220188 RepID=A0A4S3JUB3_9EURO|nr:uncharacterized protein ATNIH1004_006085 [Aspergillus tanneri]KAA8647392.1 hypothetical protein ATNIH1004_006085 [Aspergillus tanneri]THC98911.1 hypothetical protein EYZ11_001624 [Aspergillus tanneri]